MDSKTLTLDINAKNYTSNWDIIDHIASEFDIKWTHLWYAPEHEVKSIDGFIDRMADLGWLINDIDNIIINITLPKNKPRKKIKDLDKLIETFNEIKIRQKNRNLEINWINLN